MNGHTPGPWKVGGVDDSCVTPPNNRDERICVCWDARPTELEDGGFEDHGDEIQANARLIAAAPELLEALREMVMLRCLGGATPDNDSATQRSVNAINKAEGKVE